MIGGKTMDQTSDVPVEVLIAAFQEENGAEDALRKLKDAKKEGLIGIKNAAVLWKDDKGQLHFKETADMRGGKGMAVGGVIGGVVGLIFPPSILASAAVGAAVGGLSAKLRDSGFSDKRLREVGDGLRPGTSALIAVIEHVWVREVEAQLRENATDVVTEVVRADIAAQLESDSLATMTASGDTAPASSDAVSSDTTSTTDEASASTTTPPPTSETSSGTTTNPA
jgi:uncharacterized membrane protein